MAADADPCPPRADVAQPLPATLTVRAGRDAYLAENGFNTAGYDAAYSEVVVLGGLKVRVPNSTSRRRALPLHDLHHVLTGYGTDQTGEAEISAWELRRGLGGLGFFVGSIVVSLVLLGLLIAPRRTWRAFNICVGHESLFNLRDPLAYEQLLGLSVGALRAQLGIPEAGLQRGPRGLYVMAPARRV